MRAKSIVRLLFLIALGACLAVSGAPVGTPLPMLPVPQPPTRLEDPGCTREGKTLAPASAGQERPADGKRSDEAVR